MIDVDLDRSLLILNDRRFPAVALICPEYTEGEPRTDEERILGGPSYDPARNSAWEVYVPLESGALIEVKYQPDDGRTDATLSALTCHLSLLGQPEDTCWLPHFMQASEGTIGVRFRRGSGMWMWCDHDWLAEHIDRLSRMRVELPSGPRCRPISLAQTWAIMARTPVS